MPRSGKTGGGGIYLTCHLATKSLLAANLLDIPMTINFKPGGIGAVAYNYVVGGVRNDDSDMIVSASSGSVLNLAIKSSAVTMSMPFAGWEPLEPTTV